MNDIVKAPAADIAGARHPAGDMTIGPSTMMTMLERLAKDPAVDADKLERLLAMQERMEAREAERKFGDALMRIQARAPRIPKNGIVNLGAGKGSYNFANWEDMDALVGPILRDEGFAVTFSEDGVSEQGIRWSASWRAFGHSEKNFITLPPDSGAGRNALQARGSTNSYAKRYLTEDFLKLVREGADDDGKRGGTKFVTEKQADELRDMCKRVGRQEGPFLDRLFRSADPPIRSFEEVDAGSGYIVAKNMLGQLIAQMESKGGAS